MKPIEWESKREIDYQRNGLRDDRKRERGRMKGWTTSRKKGVKEDKTIRVREQEKNERNAKEMKREGELEEE